jgi:hypothetical protein
VFENRRGWFQKLGPAAVGPMYPFAEKIQAAVIHMGMAVDGNPATSFMIRFSDGIAASRAASHLATGFDT